MYNYKQCPHRMEGCYYKDSWQTYDACKLYNDMWDYYDCDHNADYCIFNKYSDEDLIQYEKEKEIKKLAAKLNNKQREKIILEQEIEDLIQQINNYRNGGD